MDPSQVIIRPVVSEKTYEPPADLAWPGRKGI